MKYGEGKLQQECIKYFRYAYPKYRYLLFAIPNGGGRTAAMAKILIGEGVVSGVADIFFSVPNKHYHGMYIEMKFGKNKQTDTQKEFERAVKEQGYSYVICRSFDEFKITIENYLK